VGYQISNGISHVAPYILLLKSASPKSVI